MVRDVPFRYEYFQSNDFVQEKGRLVPQDEADRMAPRLRTPVPVGTEIEEIRLLSNSTFLNDSTEPAQAHWKHDNATQASICSAVPLGSCRFRVYDITSAYSTCLLWNRVKFNKNWSRAEKLEWVQNLQPGDSSLLCVSVFNGELVMYVGGQQGNAQMAEFFGSHMADIFYFTFGDFWQNMWCLYVDDIGPHGFTDEQLELRCRLLEACLEVFDKPICTKFWEDGNRPPAQSSMVLAGIEFTTLGVTIGQNTDGGHHEVRVHRDEGRYA